MGEDSLDGNVHGGGVECLKHDLGHLLSVGLGVEGSLSQKDRVLLRSNTELVVEGVMPDLLHVIPVGDNSMVNGVLQQQDTSLGLGLISNINILARHTHHGTGMLGSSNDGRKDSSWRIISGKSSLHHTGSIVTDNCRCFLVHSAPC